jgi:hypothetical protein
MERIYRRTGGGLAAWKDDKSGLSLPFRRILSLIDGDTHYSVIRAGMALCRDEQLSVWLEQLETLCFLESATPVADASLDFMSYCTAPRQTR